MKSVINFRKTERKRKSVGICQIYSNVRRQKIHPSFEVLGPEVQNRGSDPVILSSITSLFVHHTSTRSGLKLNRDNCIPICSPLLDDEGIFINIKKSRFALCCNGKNICFILGEHTFCKKKLTNILIGKEKRCRPKGFSKWGGTVLSQMGGRTSCFHMHLKLLNVWKKVIPEYFGLSTRCRPSSG